MEVCGQKSEFYRTEVFWYEDSESVVFLLNRDENSLNIGRTN